MCGIAGIYLYSNENIQKLPEWLLQQVNVIEHRGRDETGFHIDQRVGLGNTRLSVIDIEGGSQPIASEDKRYVIVYNGEVYNFLSLRTELEKLGYQFKSNSDTEVVLHAFEEFGEESVSRLNGMFAFAVWDRKEQSLFLARDRFGVKPLFYYADMQFFCFASELQAILVIPKVRRTISPKGLAVYLGHNYLPPPFTLFSEIKQLKPGHSMHIKRDGNILINQWNRLRPLKTLQISEPELDERFSFYLERAVELQLVSDVPLGAFLSGGLDSTALISILAEKKGSGINTFSVGFKEAEYDESPYALEVAKQFGTEHHPLWMGHEMFFKEFQESISNQANPIADQATVQLLALSKLARRYVKVCLSGDGGDELLGGYITIFADRYQPILKYIPQRLTNIYSTLLSILGAGTGKISFDYKLKSFLSGAGMSKEDAHAMWRMIHNFNDLRQILSDDIIIDEDWLYQPYRAAYAESENTDFFTKSQLADMMVWLAGNNLPKVDSMSMAANLEVRVPFLDNDLVEFLLQIPASQKVIGHKLKIILKRYLQCKGLSTNIVQRKKAGFHSPIAIWFKGPLRPKLDEIFNDQRSLYEDGLIRQGIPTRLLKEHATGKSNNAFKLFGLALLFLWYEEFVNNS